MGYYNMIFQYGENAFLKKCKITGINGLIVVDLPWPENKKFANKCKKKSIYFIQLLSPTTTKQRLKICDVLFNTDKTFHFTINDLSKIIREKLSERISLATIYNTIHAFEKKGYLKEIAINSSQTYFDTNISVHHHFF